jgi:AcrR family transcriptional regulator
MKRAETRGYEMTARAESTAHTAGRILDATAAAFWDEPADDPSLDVIAERAGVSVRTVIRRFGSKEQLLVAAADRERQRVVDQRASAPIGDVFGAVHVLMDHYEEFGEKVLRLLAAQETVPGLRPIVEQGRDVHRQWCQRVFAPCLADLEPVESRRRIAQFVAICDVYTWKLLRLDAGLSRRQAEVALAEMLTPFTKES